MFDRLIPAMRRPLFWPFIGVIAALLLAACPQPAADPVPFEIVLNTGYDQAAGMTIAYGTPDDSWDLVTWVPAPTLSYGSNLSYGCGLGA